MNTKKAEATMTLREGLKEFRNTVPNLVFEDNYSGERSKTLFQGHDVIHVIAGLGTSVKEESLVDTFTYCATDLTFREGLKYYDLPEVKDILKNVNKIELIFGSLRAIPNAFKVWRSSKKMPKKWSYFEWEKYLDKSLIEIRKEFQINIKAYQY